MPVPQELASSERLPVSGRLGWTATQAVRFGEYEAASVDRTWTRGSGLRINQYSRERRGQGYAFTLRGPASAPAWRVECDAMLRVRGAVARGITIEAENRSALDCNLREDGAAAPEPWRLSLSEEGEKPLGGSLTGEGGRVEVSGTSQVQGGALPAGITTGYRLLRDGRAVAAVEVMNDGAVWLNVSDARERSLMAATAAALLLLEDLRASLRSD